MITGCLHIITINVTRFIVNASGDYRETEYLRWWDGERSGCFLSLKKRKCFLRIRHDVKQPVEIVNPRLRVNKYLFLGNLVCR